MPASPPVAVAVEVVAAQPIEADAAALAPVRRGRDPEATPITYLVKVRLAAVPPATGFGWALYVRDFRIPKYWQYVAGIFFKIYDPQFFADHAGGALRFSADAGAHFIETGLTLSRPDVVPESVTAATELPTQREALER
jgi:hypothetical protein